MKVVIIGGGASGASCAARLRRLDDSIEITILEKTSETSIASCGLPYFIGEVIEDKDDMQVAKPEVFKKLFNIDIYLNSEVVEIHPQEKFVLTSDQKKYAYDKLVVATGAQPVVLDILGKEKLKSFVVKNLSDADAIKGYIKSTQAKACAVIGGGFIGVEVAENLCHLGIKTALIERSEQVLPPLDLDMILPIHKEMKDNGIELFLSDGIKEITSSGLILSSDKEVPADFVIWAVGTRPNTSIAQMAGVKTTDRGFMITDDFMQTSIEDIYACGDNIVTKDFVSGANSGSSLAGPANREGRLIADHIKNHLYPYMGTQGTGIIKVFDLTTAFTGNNEKQLKQQHISYKKMIITGSSHAGYYPGSSPLFLKVLYNDNGDILGAQAIGKEGVDKRIDVLATVMRLKGKISDLRDAELCYAPPYSSAKDPINIMGMAIENVQRGLFQPYFDSNFADKVILDVRPNQMYEKEHIEGAINIPSGQIRNRMNELPKDKPIVVYCVKGYTSYVVCRILEQNGFNNVMSYAGGWLYYKNFVKENM